MPGERIQFLSPSGDGMVAEIAENRTNEFISIRQLGLIKKGVEDTESEAVRAWAPVYENYTCRCGRLNSDVGHRMRRSRL